MRNSLTPISIGIDLLSTCSDNEKQELLSVLRISCDSLCHILSDVLSMQKIEEGKYSLEKEWFSMGLDLQNLANQYEITVRDSWMKYEIVFLSRHSTSVCLSFFFISIDVGDLLIVAVAVLIT